MAYEIRDDAPVFEVGDKVAVDGELVQGTGWVTGYLSAEYMRTRKGGELMYHWRMGEAFPQALVLLEGDREDHLRTIHMNGDDLAAGKVTLVQQGDGEGLAAYLKELADAEVAAEEEAERQNQEEMRRAWEEDRTYVTNHQETRAEAGTCSICATEGQVLGVDAADDSWGEERWYTVVRLCRTCIEHMFAKESSHETG